MVLALYPFTIVWLGVHFSAYVLALRGRSSFQRESIILFYHAASAILLFALFISLSVGLANIQIFVAGAGLIALHGIYSLTFLEFWTLSQISYSLAIIQEIERHGGISRSNLPSGLTEIGRLKRLGRLEAMARKGLITRAGEQWQVTGRGRAVAWFLSFVRFAVNLQVTG